ncbi:MAG: CapA family protein [Candidatus Firestonebacteria bacterium]
MKNNSGCPHLMWVLFYILLISECFCETLSLIAVGDIMLGRYVDVVLEKKPPVYPYEKVKSIISSADITFGNLECSLARDPSKEKPILTGYVFKASSDYSDGLKEAGFDILSLANNHSKGGGKGTIVKTIDVLNKKGIVTVGAGENLDKARELKIIKVDNIKVVFIASTLVCPEIYLAKEDESGVYKSDENLILEDVKKAKQISSIVIVSLHWGEEKEFTPTNSQRDLAHKIIDNGCDLIIGHHPHVLQGLEIYKGKLIVYSLGNFIFDKTKETSKTNKSIILKCFFNKDTLSINKVEIFPVVLRYDRFFPELAEGNDKDEIISLIRDISKFCGNFC